MSEPKWRHEYKYQVDAMQLAILENRAGCVMHKDTHVSSEGKFRGLYNIRSVYFDDMYNTCYMENEEGTDPREKFRIRIYNHSDETISLELKCKRAGKCRKYSCPITREQCETLLAGRCLPDSRDYPPLLQKLLVQMKTRGLHPVVTVEYERVPFIYPVGNVRVTLDYNTRSGKQFDRFFDDDLLLRPIQPGGQQLLEVKWDELLPDFIYQFLGFDDLQWTRFSKFYLCRRAQLYDNTERGELKCHL